MTDHMVFTADFQVQLDTDALSQANLENIYDPSPDQTDHILFLIPHKKYSKWVKWRLSF